MAATLKRVIRATEEELMDGTNGACLACGEAAFRGERQVYGLEELLMMGRLELAGEDGE